MISEEPEDCDNEDDDDAADDDETAMRQFSRQNTLAE